MARAAVCVLAVAAAFQAVHVLGHSPSNCTCKPNVDFNGGDVAPHVLLDPKPYTSSTVMHALGAKCCSLCADTPNCRIGVLAGRTHAPPFACWFKGLKGHLKSNTDVLACSEDFPPLPPLPPPPPPPPPQCYRSTVVKFEPKPSISYVDGGSDYQQVFNPSWIQGSSGTHGKAGLIIRTQNCSSVVGGGCAACSGTGGRASSMTFAELLNSDNGTASVLSVACVSLGIPLHHPVWQWARAVDTIIRVLTQSPSLYNYM